MQCGMKLVVGAGRPSVERWPEFPTNKGGLCKKGWTAAELLGHRDRLTEPLVRDRRDSDSGSAGHRLLVGDERVEPVDGRRRVPRIESDGVAHDGSCMAASQGTLAWPVSGSTSAARW